MNYHIIYINYKNKYIQLKNNIFGGNSNDNKSYQDIVFELAKFIKPNLLHKFKKDFGLKQLSNQVIELNKVTFLNELQNNMQDYYMTDKIDGKRTILYLTNDQSYAVSDKLNKIDITTNDTCILDTEFYDDKYYIFDVMVYEGENLINLPFEQRMKYFTKFNSDIIKTKPFIKLNKNYKQQIREFKNGKKPYNVDGIIFTPADGLYNTMKVYKYKPPDHLTIDFLIKKCPPELLIQEPYNANKNKTLYLLFCGIAKKVFFKLRMRYMRYYHKMFPNIDTKNLPHYFPIQFEPSSLKYAYLFWSDDSNLNNEVGEFLYDTENKEWKLKKLRLDRKIEIGRGYYGNNYKICEFNWMAYSDPLIIETSEDNKDSELSSDITSSDTTSSDVLSTSEESITTKNNIYFQEHDNVLQKASRNYNSFVKSQIFSKFKNTDWVMDLASGKGQDLFRYSTFNMKNVIFLEIDKTALEELITRKHNFAMSDKYRNSMNILIQNVDLLEPYKNTIAAINNVYTLQNIDLIMCNFAFHYFVKDKESIENICKLINYYLKKNGRLVFTSFDGQKIVDLLKQNNGEWIIYDNDQIKYGIKKMYNGDKLLDAGQKIGVKLPFSSSKFYGEYLININVIEKELSKFDIILDASESFSKYMNDYKGYMDNNDKIYVDLYHYYIFTKK
jgi:hypothetical protein